MLKFLFVGMVMSCDRIQCDAIVLYMVFLWPHAIVGVTGKVSLTAPHDLFCYPLLANQSLPAIAVVVAITFAQPKWFEGFGRGISVVHQWCQGIQFDAKVGGTGKVASTSRNVIASIAMQTLETGNTIVIVVAVSFA
jgi:hypothetical protein